MEHNTEQEPHPDYLKGFNEGYSIREQFPELAEAINKAFESITSERAKGFQAGSDEYMQEREKIMTVPWLQQLPDDYDNIEPEQEKSRDDIEPEIE